MLGMENTIMKQTHDTAMPRNARITCPSTWRLWTPMPGCRRLVPAFAHQGHHLNMQALTVCFMRIRIHLADCWRHLYSGLNLATYCCPVSNAVSGSASLQEAGNVRQSLFTAGAMSLCRPETAEASSSPSESSESLSSLMLPFTMKVATC